MSSPTSSSPASGSPASSNNEAEIRYWNEDSGRVWVEAQERLDRLLAPITAELVEQAAIRPGERVLDVGCGCGDTSITLARLGARVRGVDVSAPMLARARERAAGQDGVRFIEADASSHPFEAEHDLLFSRFGVMFFTDPHGAFTHLRSALDDGGRLCFMCWQPPRANPWMAIAGAAVQPFLPEPATPPDPRAPGPFAFADPDHVRDVLGQAGFVDIEIDGFTPSLHLADDLDEALRLQARVGPLARVMKELEGEQRDAAVAAARAALAPHMGASGLVLGAACWLVRAGT